ncbi:hypothetical protein, partial [Pseudomonas sp. NPDC089758]|uniref:hypothetical protein n=1 Tax=Pseudomonas sp. NPDC089758 TaxID=3364473 RepID=UPI0038108F22
RLGVEVDFFDFAVGAHHAGLAPEGNREHSIGHQVSALNVGFMEHLLKDDDEALRFWDELVATLVRI